MKPFGVSYLKDNSFGITVCKVGPFTDKLFKLKKGDVVGIQGPYGNSFSTTTKNAVLVAGGYGAAPLGFLADTLVKKGTKVTFIIGAKCDDELVYKQRFKNSKVNLIMTTDDGSCGRKGFTTDVLKNFLQINKKVDMIYSCGPEIMTKGVFRIAQGKNIRIQASLEAYIKCGIGICDECSICGQRICKDGPVFDEYQLKKLLK